MLGVGVPCPGPAGVRLMTPSIPGRPPLALPVSLHLLPHLLLCRKPWAHRPPALQLRPIYLCPRPSRGSPRRCWGSRPSWGAGERPPAGMPPRGRSGRGPGGGQGRQPGCLTAVTAHVSWGGCPPWGMLGPEAGSVRPMVVAFAGDQVSCPRRCQSPLAHKDHWEWLLETWVPAPATLGVRSLGQGAGICIWRKLPRWFSCPGHTGHPAGSVPDKETQGRHRTMASHQADTQPSAPQVHLPSSRPAYGTMASHQKARPP